MGCFEKHGNVRLLLLARHFVKMGVAMGNKRGLIAAAFMLSFLLAGVSPASAVVFCDPSTINASCLAAGSNYCEQLGKTTMDGDEKNIIACLSNVENNSNCSTGDCTWKAITGGSGSTKEITISQAELKMYSPSCSNPSTNYTNCTYACTQFCINSKTDGVPNNYVSGFLSAWAAGQATCACFH